MTTNRPLPSKMVERALAAWLADDSDGVDWKLHATHAALSAAGVDKLIEALRLLSNEVHGVIGAFGPEMRDCIGNTNVECLRMRLIGAADALAAAENGGGE